MIVHMTLHELAAEKFPRDPAQQAQFLAAMHKAATETCSVCGTETHRTHQHTGPLMDDGGQGVYDICADCWQTATKAAALLGVDLLAAEQDNADGTGHEYKYSIDERSMTLVSNTGTGVSLLDGPEDEALEFLRAWLRERQS